MQHRTAPANGLRQVDAAARDDHALASAAPREPVVLVVERRDRLTRGYNHLFDYLGIRPVCVRGSKELKAALRALQPLAVVSELDAGALDGCHVMGLVAEHDANLPIMVFADEDPRMLGAIAATAEFWQLTDVVKLAAEPGLQDMVEFLFRAGLRNGTGHVLPA